MQRNTENRIIVENVVRNHGYHINTIMFVDNWASADDVRFGAPAEETCALLASCETCESSKIIAPIWSHHTKRSQHLVKSINFPIFRHAIVRYAK